MFEDVHAPETAVFYIARELHCLWCSLRDYARSGRTRGNSEALEAKFIQKAFSADFAHRISLKIQLNGIRYVRWAGIS